MTHFDPAAARPAFAAAGTIIRIATAIAGAIAAAGRRLDRAATDDLAIRELKAMPDHMLRDIGIDRLDIRRRVRGLGDDD